MAETETNRIVVYRLRAGKPLDELDFAERGYQVEYADDTTRLLVKRGEPAPPHCDSGDTILNC